MSTLIPHWRDGARWPGAAARTGDVHDPATGRVAAQVSFASAEEVDAVVREARVAGRAWAEGSLSRRTSVLFAFREALVPARTDGILLPDTTSRPPSPPSTARSSTTRWGRCSGGWRSRSSRAVPRTC